MVLRLSQGLITTKFDAPSACFYGFGNPIGGILEMTKILPFGTFAFAVIVLSIRGPVIDVKTACVFLSMLPAALIGMAFILCLNPRRRLHHINRAIMHHGKERGDAEIRLGELRAEMESGTTLSSKLERSIEIWGLIYNNEDAALVKLRKMRFAAKQELDAEQEKLNSYLSHGSQKE